MAEFFVGQIMMTGFGFSPRYFVQCNGGTLPINQNMALFSLLGTTYGGDGVTSFKLPDLRGRTGVGGGFVSADPMWQPPRYSLGAIGGTETVSLTSDENAPHTHRVTATADAGTVGYPSGTEVLAATSDAAPIYGPAQALLPLGGGPSTSMGSGAPHDNMQPFQAINFCMALVGTFPSRS